MNEIERKINLSKTYKVSIDEDNYQKNLKIRQAFCIIEEVFQSQISQLLQ